jgi:DNA-binding transcriptional LysR family regulator
VQLTERAGRRVRPTAAGEADARNAAHVLGLLREGAEVADEAARGADGRLRISAVTTAGEHLAPPLIQAFRDHHPELSVSLHVGNREEVFRRIASHEADVAISGQPPEGRELEGKVFAENEFALITAPDDPLSKRPWVTVEEIGERPWLMREQGSGTRRLCQTYLSTNQIDPPQLTLGSNGAIKNAARVGLGVALQSRHAIQLELDFGLLATIRPRGGLPKRSWYVVRSKVGPGRSSADAFTKYVSSAAARHALARAHGDEVQQTKRRLASG